MGRVKLLSLFLLLLPLIATTLRLDLRGVTALPPTSLTAWQEGYPELKFTAHYSVKPIEKSTYYAWRIARWKGKRAWELELVHHKLYLDNPPPQIQRFQITHGYNLLTVNRAWDKGKYILRAGAGLVITHPETIVRGKELPWNRSPGGFYLSGPTAQVAAGKAIKLAGPFGLSLEVKFTASYAWIPIEDGYAYVPNLAIHFLAGFSFVLTP